MEGYLKNEIARIHREGVVLELEQLGLKLDPKYSLCWFEDVWDEVKPKYIKTHKHGFIANFEGEIMLYVDPDYHRNGIGSDLIKDVDGMVWVLKGNKMAEGFYAKNGFYNTGKRRNVVMFGHEVVLHLWKGGENETNKS